MSQYQNRMAVTNNKQPQIYVGARLQSKIDEKVFVVKKLHANGVWAEEDDRYKMEIFLTAKCIPAPY